MNIYILSPDNNTPSGGVKQLYRHVDILNSYGFSGSIIHQKDDFRCTWFKNDTRISYASSTKLDISDFLVVPEIYGPNISKIKKGIRKVIFNQNCYYTFRGYPLKKTDNIPAYLDKEIVASLVVSDDSKAYLQYVFPRLKVHRIHCGIDGAVFGYEPNKKPKIAFMPRKNNEDLRQVINILNYRGSLKNFGLIPIREKTETEVARILKESLIFLSFSHAEGFGLPAAEAMACGCVVIGYHGSGGREYFKPEFSYPISQGEIISFVKTVEKVIRKTEVDPKLLEEKGKRAAFFIKENYSMQREEKDVIQFWGNIEGSLGSRAY